MALTLMGSALVATFPLYAPQQREHTSGQPDIPDPVQFGVCGNKENIRQAVCGLKEQETKNYYSILQ